MKIMKISLSALFILLVTFSVFAQKSQPTPPQTEEDSVVKVTTDLVQIDAVVTDKQGNPVTDLTANDVEILQDGKPQKITNFSYVNSEIRKQTQTLVDKKTDKKTPLPPPARLDSANTGRIITFVVDDGNCQVTLGGMRAAREGLEDFINKQMQPNDLVAIYQTRRGSSMLQQYTSDKARLLQIVRKIRWYPAGGTCSITGEDYEAARNDSTLKSEGTQTFESDRDRERRETAENYNKDRATVGTLGVLRYALNGLQRIGGRKVMFIMSDALPISNGRNTIFNSFYDVRDLTELANRASVVINTIDVRGLIAPGASASDDFGIKNNMMAVEDVMQRRRLSDNARQSGLAYTASETGGKFYKDMNYLNYPIQEALKLEKGYYLIGYQPEEETFKGKKFHKIEIKLKRPDLIVSSRSGFTGLTDKEISPKPRTGDSELYDALIAPLPNSGLNLQLSAFFSNTPTGGNFVRSLLHLDGDAITFVDDTNGMKRAIFDVIAVTLDEKNKVVDEFNRTYTVRIPADKLSTVQKNGLNFTTDVPIKKSGVYNFRIAMRDASSKQIGSAGQPIEVPDLKRDKIFVSGLSISKPDETGKFVFVSTAKLESGFSPVLSMAMPEIRQFRRGDVLAYSYSIYNAQLDKTTGKPKLTAQVILYREGEVALKGDPQPVEPESQNNWTRVDDYGYLRLKPDTLTGDYALQIVVRDTLSNEVSTQWIDFRVVE